MKLVHLKMAHVHETTARNMSYATQLPECISCCIMLYHRMRWHLSSSYQLACCEHFSSVQELAFVLTDMLLLPCIDPTNEASNVSSHDCGHSRVGLELVDKRLVHYSVLSRCPACIKGAGSCLYFWERAMPHCCQWLKQHIDWMLSCEMGGRLDISPYLDVLGGSESDAHACLAKIHLLAGHVCCKQSSLL